MSKFCSCALLSAFLLLSLLHTASPLSAISTSYTVGQSAIYVFAQNGSFAANTAMTYVIEFAAEYDLSNVNAPTDCVGVSRFTVNSCSVDTVTNKITIGATVENDFSVRVGSCSDQIHNVVNPGAEGSYTIKSEYTYQGVQSNPSQTINLTARILNSVALASSVTTANTLGSITVSIDTTIAMAQNDLIEFYVPQWFQVGTNIYITSTSPTCIFTISGGTPTAASSCNFVEGSSQTGTLTAALPAAVPANDATNLVLQVQNFRSPPSTAQVSGFIVRTKSSSGHVQEKLESGITLKVTDPDPTLSVNVGSSPTTVDEAATFSIRVSPSYYPANAKLQVTFPSEILFEKSGVIIFNSVENAFGLPITASRASQVVTVEGVTSVAGSSSFEIFVKLAYNPSSEEPTSAFQVILMDSGNNQIHSSTTQTYTATAAAITTASVAPVVNTVGASTTYNLKFNPISSPPSDAKIKLTFPSDVEVTGSSACTSFTNLNAGASCVRTLNQIEITNPFSSGYSHGSECSIGISDIVNPLSVKTTASFTIAVASSSDYAIQSTASSGGATLTYTASVGALSNIAITLSDQTTSQSPVTYQYCFKTAGKVMAGSVASIQIASEVTILSQSTAQSSCTVVSGLSGITCSFSSSSLFTLSNGFSADYEGGSAATALCFSMAQYKNPRSNKPSSVFTITLAISTGENSYTGTTTVTASTVAALAAGSVSPASTINGAENVYTFTTSSPAATQVGDFYRVTLPSELGISSSPTCAGSSPLASSLTCAINSGALLITISRADATNTEIAALTSLSFAVTNGINQADLSTSTSIEMRHQLEQASSYYDIGQKTSGITITTDMLATFGTITISPSSTNIAESTSYTFAFTSPVSKIPAGTIIKLTFPPEITLGTPSCTGSGGVATSPTCTKQNTDTVVVSDGFPSQTTNTNVNIVVSGVTNGNTSGASQSFAVKMTTSTPNDIASQTSGLTVTLTCDSNCLTCSGTATTCVTCDTSSSFKYFNSNDNKCYDDCPTGFFNNDLSTPVCTACNSPCTDCSTSASVCTACDTAATLKYLYNGGCVATCPDTTYLATNECQTCSSPCVNCETSATNCLSCDTGSSLPLLHSNTCLASCPDGYVAIGDQCQQCNSPCATCGPTVDICLSCSGTQLLHSSTCVDSCPSGFKANSNGTQCEADTTTVDEVLYFIFLGTFGVILAIVGIMRLVLVEMRCIQSVLAIEATVEVGVWFFMLYFLIRDGHLISGAIVGGAIVFHYLTSWMIFCADRRLVKKDGLYKHYKERFKCTHKFTLVYSGIVSHKFYRLMASYLFHLDSLNMKIDNRARYVKALTFITIFSMLFTSFPIIFACILNIFFNTTQQQLFFTDIEVALITALMWMFEVIEAVREHKYLSEEVRRKKKRTADKSEIPFIRGADDASDFSDEIPKNNTSVKERDYKQQVLKMYFDQVLKRTNTLFNEGMIDEEEEDIVKGYESEDEGQNRGKAQRFPHDKRLTSSYPATPRTLERTNKNFVSMKLVEGGELANFQSLLLNSGQNWNRKFRKVPPSRDLNKDFGDLMTEENMSFMGGGALRDPPPHLNFSPQLARPGTEELINRDDKLKEIKKQLEEEQKRLQADKDVFEQEKKRFLEDKEKLRNGRVSPVGPAYFPAPFRKKSNQNTSDEEEDIKKGRRSSMDGTSTLFLKKSNMDDTMSGGHSLRGAGASPHARSPVDSRMQSPEMSRHYPNSNSRVELRPEDEAIPALMGSVYSSKSRQPHQKQSDKRSERKSEKRNEKKSGKRSEKKIEKQEPKPEEPSMEQSRVSGKQVPSLTAVRRISPVQSPQLSPRGSDIKAQSIYDSSGKFDNPKAPLLPHQSRQQSVPSKKQELPKKSEAARRSPAPKHSEAPKKSEKKAKGPKNPEVSNQSEARPAVVPSKQKSVSRREVKPDERGYDTVDIPIESEEEMFKPEVAQGEAAAFESDQSLLMKDSSIPPQQVAGEPKKQSRKESRKEKRKEEEKEPQQKREHPAESNQGIKPEAKKDSKQEMKGSKKEVREESKLKAQPSKPQKETAAPQPKLNESNLDAPSDRDQSIILPEQPSSASHDSQEEELDSARPEDAPLLSAGPKNQRKESEKIPQRSVSKKPESRQKSKQPSILERNDAVSPSIKQVKSPTIMEDLGAGETQEDKQYSPDEIKTERKQQSPQLESSPPSVVPVQEHSQKPISKKDEKPAEVAPMLKKEQKSEAAEKKRKTDEKKSKQEDKKKPNEKKNREEEKKEVSETREEAEISKEQEGEEEREEREVLSDLKPEDSIEEVDDQHTDDEQEQEKEDEENQAENQEQEQTEEEDRESQEFHPDEQVSKQAPKVEGIPKPNSVVKSDKKPESIKKPKEEKKNPKKQEKKAIPNKEKKQATNQEVKKQPQERKPSPQKVASRDPSVKKEAVKEQAVRKQQIEPKRDASQHSRQPSVNKSTDQSRSLRKEVSPSVKDITPSLRSKASEPKQRPRDSSINKSLRSGAESSDQPALSKVPSRRADPPLKQRGTTNPSQKKSSVAPSADESSIMSRPGRTQQSHVTPSSLRPNKNSKSRSNIKPISSKKFESDQSREESIAQSSQRFGSRKLEAIPDFKKRDPSVKKLNQDSVQESDEAQFVEQLSELEEELKDPGPLKWNSVKTQDSKKSRGPTQKKSSIPQDIFQQASKMFPEEQAEGEEAAPPLIQTVSPRPLDKQEHKKRSPREQPKETKKGVKVLFSDHSTTSVDTDMGLKPTQFYPQNDWQKQRRLAKGNTQSVQLNMRRVGGIQSTLNPDFNSYTPTPGNAPAGYPTVGHPLSHVPMSARPNIGVSSVSPVLQKGGTLALGGDPRALNNLIKESRERDAADMVGGFGTLDPLKQAQGWGPPDSLPPEEEFKNFATRNINFFPNSNRSIDHSNEEMLSNGPLSGRNQAIQLNPGYHPSSLTPNSGQNTPFAFNQQAPVYLGPGQPTGYSKRSQLKRTGFNDVSPFPDDMLQRAYNNPTSFERNVIQGRIRDDLFDESVTYVNRGQGLQEVHSSAKRKPNRASKVNLHAERGDIPPGGMKPVLKAKIKNLEQAYMQNKTVKKDKSKAKLNNVNLMHVMPPQGDPPMSRMSPIPPNHQNYAFSPRK